MADHGVVFVGDGAAVITNALSDLEADSGGHQSFPRRGSSSEESETRMFFSIVSSIDRSSGRLRNVVSKSSPLFKRRLEYMTLPLGGAGMTRARLSSLKARIPEQRVLESECFAIEARRGDPTAETRLCHGTPLPGSFRTAQCIASPVDVPPLSLGLIAARFVTDF